MAEIRAALRESPEGPPLLLIAPKQATYQLERQLLADDSIQGYTRLRIFSFERLAEFILDEAQKPALRLLSEQGRLMVLRALLARKHSALKLFHGSARLTGFAQQLNDALRELQRHLLTPEKLRELAERFATNEGLSFKLHDFATMLEEYSRWLEEHHLQDADCLLDEAVQALHSKSAIGNRQSAIQDLWLDGFAEMSPQELNLLAALIPRCEHATITFCLDRVPAEKVSWLSNWSVVRRAFEECRERLKGLPDCELKIDLLKREPLKSRFENQTLSKLEKNWAEPASDLKSEISNFKSAGADDSQQALRVAKCANPEAEAALAAREILSHVRNGGRFRDVTVLVRKLENYHAGLERVFRRYEIPFFLDRRESVAHHPLAELTRSALRTVALGWPHGDWFAALKSGLVPVDETEIDRLENEALARGWKGATWQNEISIPQDQRLTESFERLRKKIAPPFQRLEINLRGQSGKPAGRQLAAALRQFWSDLEVQKQLEDWAAETADCADSKKEIRVISGSIHATVWEQMDEWLKNLELGFADEPLSLRDWLPVVEAGLGSFTVGVIPPALDQVLIGSVERSRNPDVKLAIVLGVNETIFPSPPEQGVLLTQADRDALENQNVALSGSAKQQLGRERFFAYVAFTRARERLVLTCAGADSNGQTLNPSPFLSQIQRIFPSAELERYSETPEWHDSQHVSELIPALLAEARGKSSDWRQFVKLPTLISLMERVESFSRQEDAGSLSPELARRLYGTTLKTSVSRLEQFAMCPFRFFVHSGLRAEERKTFELDPKEQGSFQHDVLKFFHLDLQREKKRWRDLTPQEARERIGKIGRGMLASYRDGLLEAGEESRFKARALIESLQDFVETLVAWMRGQYQFDPVVAELAFGEGEIPPWELELSEGRRLALHGRIDRVDVFRKSDEEALCAVIDYKSSVKKLEPLLVENGIQLQLLAYLNVVRRWPEPEKIFGASRLIPAGVFYVNLRGKYERGENRNDALTEIETTRRQAYKHTGRFDASHLEHLDCSGSKKGEQFNYSRNKDGSISKRSSEPLDGAQFIALLDSLEMKMKELGERILSGDTRIDPYKKSSATACEHCSYGAICRIDPWTHEFRELKKTVGESSEG